MVIDSSAIIALLLGEPEAPRLIRAIADAPRRLACVVSILECAIVIAAKKGPPGERELDLLLHKGKIDTVSMDSGQLDAARAAYSRYGRGKHPAGLNLGDCCAYALARTTGEPLLFKGGDFGKTDVAGVAY